MNYYSRDYHSRTGGLTHTSKLPSVSMTTTSTRRLPAASVSTSRPTPHHTSTTSSGMGMVTSEIRDLKIHAVSSHHNGVSNYNTSLLSSTYSAELSKKPVTSNLQMLQPSYSISDRPLQTDKTIPVKNYSEDSSSELHQRPGKRMTSAGFCGLRNLGNTCYMNSILQCLSNTRPLLEYLLSGEYRKELNTTTSTCKGALISAFAELLSNMWDGVSTCVSPSAFKSGIQQFAPRFSGYNQQDAQEFLRYLMQGLQEDVNRIRQRVKVKPLDEKAMERCSHDERADIYWKHYHLFDDSRMVDIFVGQLKSTLKCQVCGNESVAYDPFWDLSLPLIRNAKMDLLQCLAGFMREELLDGQEKARCDHCQKPQPCKKWFSIHRFPSILVLHLKRFSQGSYGSKLTTSVDFPVRNLNLTQFCDSPHVSSQVPTYDLYAISNHSGSMYSGHYTAFARHPYDMQWYEYNDSRVNSISSRNLVTPEAYVLFYEKSSQLTY